MLCSVHVCPVLSVSVCVRWCTSSVSAVRRVDHTNSMMATKTAMMRPQIRTTKIPPMFSMPSPETQRWTHHRSIHLHLSTSLRTVSKHSVLSISNNRPGLKQPIFTSAIPPRLSVTCSGLLRTMRTLAQILKAFSSPCGTRCS